MIPNAYKSTHPDPQMPFFIALSMSFVFCDRLHATGRLMESILQTRKESRSLYENTYLRTFEDRLYARMLRAVSDVDDLYASSLEHREEC